MMASVVLPTSSYVAVKKVRKAVDDSQVFKIAKKPTVNATPLVTTPLVSPSPHIGERVTSTSTSTSTLVGGKNKKISEKLRNKLAKIVVSPQGQIKPFKDIGISTRTAIVYTNLLLDLNLLFAYCPITDYQPMMKRRGRRRRFCIEKVVPIIPFGSVARVQHENKVRGVLAMKPKSFTDDEHEEEGGSNASGPIEDERPIYTERQIKQEVVSATGVSANRKAFFLHCVVIDIAIDDKDGILRGNIL